MGLWKLQVLRCFTWVSGDFAGAHGSKEEELRRRAKTTIDQSQDALNSRRAKGLHYARELSLQH